MKHKQWASIYSVFETIEKLCKQLESEPDSSTTSLEEGSVEEKRDEVVKVRTDIRTQLDFLRAQLSEEFTERDSYFVLFPIVALFDELVQTRFLDVNQTSWPPLQKELFQIDDAGEVFYETLEEILQKPQTLPFTYEVYYFCLNHGFKGRYNNNPLKISEYLKKLREKITSNVPENIQTDMEETSRFKYIGSRIWYYLAACGIIIGFYFFFYGLSNVLNPESETQVQTSYKKSYEQPLIYYKTPTPPSLGKND